ncbi:hypothetical protein [Acinetobacter soli]|uniref:hypothetical protein n=1 Tax=Acinetobacter soli TaxID=487316 RepID=UPI00280E9D7F|nr:hypothetical protein [Acinetobacter soli]MDQ8942088.1 hypothetical protein [Acinetobacter soli]
MGTDVNPVAWENSKIVSMILLENDKTDTLIKAYLSFVSCTSVGGSCGGNPAKSSFVCGDKEYTLTAEEANKHSTLDNLTKVIYETFYKHQF